MFVLPKYDGCMKELLRNEVVRKHFISDVHEFSDRLEIHTIELCKSRNYIRQGGT